MQQQTQPPAAEERRTLIASLPVFSDDAAASSGPSSPYQYDADSPGFDEEDDDEQQEEESGGGRRKDARDPEEKALDLLPGPREWLQGALAVKAKLPEEAHLEDLRDDQVFVVCLVTNEIAQRWRRRKFEQDDGGLEYALWLWPLTGKLRLVTSDPHLASDERLVAEDFTREFAACREALIAARLCTHHPARGVPPASGLPTESYHVRRAALRAHFPSVAPRLAPEEDYWKLYLRSTCMGGSVIYVPVKFWLECAEAAAKQ